MVRFRAEILLLQGCVRPLGFPEQGFPAPQGPYYTGVGYKDVGSIARKIVEDISISASMPVSITRTSMLKWPRAVGIPDFRQGLKNAADQILDGPLSLLRLVEVRE